MTTEVQMRNALKAGLLFAGLTLSVQGWALSFSCDWDSNGAKPAWVNNPDYSMPGYQIGVGAASKDGRSKDEQRIASEGYAKKNLVQQIQTTIKSEDSISTQVSGNEVRKEASTKLSAYAEEDLSGLKTYSFWVDTNTCTYYTLMAISDESLAKSRHEKLMKSRMARFKDALENGTNEKKNRDLRVRRKYLEDAQAILPEVDFTLLPNELPQNVYAKRLADAQAQLSKESSNVKGRMALFILNDDHTLSNDVLGRMLDQLRSNEIPTDRPMSDCASLEECITVAKERSYTMLTLLIANSNVTTSQMGSLKGTLTVSRTVYDVESNKKVKGPDKASTQVIGWGREELDWGAAAEKAMQSFK
jgi:hypothetical protein